MSMYLLITFIFIVIMLSLFSPTASMRMFQYPTEQPNVLCYSRKDLPLKQYKSDILLITGVLSSYANVVEKLFQDLDKNKATLLRIERAGDVFNESVSSIQFPPEGDSWSVYPG